ncbi:MAG: RHS repeat-associated core domain-containing protein [Pyrinomonadaceae bacterium]
MTTFNSRLQPTKIALGTVQGGDDKLNLAYEYNTSGVADNNGNVLKQTITVNSTPGQNNGFTAVQSYAYDELNRLKSATETIGGMQSWKEAYTFDRYGNKNYDESQTTTLTRNCGTAPNLTICQQDREMENPEINPATNRIKELQPDGDSVKDYEYDPAGNTIKDPDGRKFFYDGENKQIRVAQLDSQGNETSTIGEYSFDGDGKRVKKHVPATGETTHFINDAGGKLIAEYSTIVEPASTAKANYLTNDTLGSPRILTDRDGNVGSRRDFLPFGAEIDAGTDERSTAQGYRGNDSINQKFTGYERDLETDLDFAKARVYSFLKGRFANPDTPLLDQDQLFPQSWNLYVYTRNSPTVFVDRLGNEITYASEELKAASDELRSKSKTYDDALRAFEGEGAPTLEIAMGDAGVDQVDQEKAVGIFEGTFTEPKPAGESWEYKKDKDGNPIDEDGNVITDSKQQRVDVIIKTPAEPERLVSGRITIDVSIKDDPTKIKKTLAHEVGHANHARNKPSEYLQNRSESVKEKIKHDKRPNEKEAKRFEKKVMSELE